VNDKKKINKLLIANRGEIVRRIIRTCRDKGIKSISIFSDADKDAFYLKDSDESINIGPANPLKSYLNIDSIIEAAKKCDADAIHPAYGFLSENYAFAEKAVSENFIWIGPPPNVLRNIESKCYCRTIASQLGIPVTPGTLRPIKDISEIVEFSEQYDYPLILKLDKGGGGKGIEVILDESQIKEAFDRVKGIGRVAFNSSDCYIEKFLQKPRHIEVQFLADSFNNSICLGERECSIQRRHQKIIEESPSPIVTVNDRETLFSYTVKLAQAMGYVGAGTMEFLRSEDGNYFFMEVNARLQVEHPVSEMITGVDIVRNQLTIACQEALELKQDDIKMRGHAIEARIYAEDPVSFNPSPGKITKLFLPKEVDKLRIDHALAKSSVIPPYYDPLLAKVIAWDSDRFLTINRLKEALEDIIIEGIKTTTLLNLKILDNKDFVDGNLNTAFIENFAR
jgi:acetyl/propionyl-CoA carboxylase alpha subunit